MPSTLVLLRHGQSTWNLENRFTGWTDVPLTETGEQEARTAGQLIKDAGIELTVAHSSLLIRAITTLNITLDVLGRAWLPVRRSWRLNERHYGKLQGFDKKETSDNFGPDQVFAWRRGYDTPPPPLPPDDERHSRNDPRYRDLPPDVLPATECLKDVVDRMLPYWYDAIVPDLRAGHTPVIAAHGNSLRALVKHLDGISDDDIAELNIPTGIPLIYELDDDLQRRSSHYLGDEGAARAAAEAVARQAG